jgi:DNA-binding response OmpR family regulator
LERLAALKLGAADYIEKPCPPELLLNKIAHLIAKARQEPLG